MELRHLRYFVAVAECGSFVRAAERLHISQPPLSMQIKDLELELKVRLFDRSSRRVELTPGGEAFYGAARAVLAQVEQARIAAQRAQSGEHGSLSIAFVSIADYNVLPSALKQFRERFPAIEVQLHELTTDAQLREIAAERVDVGIALGPIEAAGIEFRPLLRERMVLALPAVHPASRLGQSVALKSLGAEHFVMVPRHFAPGLHDTTTAIFQAAGLAPRISQYARQMQTVISLVAGGFGLAIVPESLQTLQRTGVCYLPLKGRYPRIEMGLIYRAQQRNPAVLRFRDSIVAAAASYAADMTSASMRVGSRPSGRKVRHRRA